VSRLAHARRGELRSIEQANNQAWADVFSFADSVAIDVSDKDLSLGVPASVDLTEEFLSYATGCMMGRYSLDHPGLILADSHDTQAAHLAAYEEKVGKPLSEVQFQPDPDAIIPVLDGEWFEDDIVARTREFLEVTFPESTVTENLSFIEESLGKDIRKYFCTEFYKKPPADLQEAAYLLDGAEPQEGFCLSDLPASLHQRHPQPGAQQLLPALLAEAGSSPRSAWPRPTQ